VFSETIKLYLHALRLNLGIFCEDGFTVFSEKRDQNVFCNISYKIRAILVKFGTPFPE